MSASDDASSPDASARDATLVLQRLVDGEASAAEELLPLVYARLRALAGSYFRGQPSDHTLQPTALVHEVYLKLINPDSIAAKNYRGRSHFMAVAATAMRQVLVDHARKKGTEKRGGNRDRVSISGLAGAAEATQEMQVLELHELLAELARLNARAARVAEMRLFGGMMPEQMASVLGVSRMTVDRDWELARAWLAGKMTESRDE